MSFSDPPPAVRAAQRELSRRQFLKSAMLTTGAAIAVPTFLSACGSSETQTPSSTGAASSSAASSSAAGATPLTTSSTVNQWDWERGGPPANEALFKADALFKAKYPDVSLKSTAQPYGNIQQVVTAANQAKSGPDVFEYFTTASLFAISPSLLQLDPYVQDFIGGLNDLEAFTQDGKLWGIPYSRQGFIWYYNKPMFAKAGITKSPETYEELLEVCKKLKAAGMVPIAGGGKDAENQAFIWYQFVAGLAPGTLYDDLFVTGKMKITDPAPRKAFESTVNLLKDNVLPGYASIPYFMDGIDTFKQGKAAIINGLASDVAHWFEFGEALGDENVGWFATVGFEGENGGKPYYYPVGSGSGWAIPNYATNQQSGLDYARLAASPDVAEVMIKVGKIPALKNAPMDKAPAVLKDILAAVEAYPHLQAGPTPEVESSIGLQMLDVLTGGTDVDSALGKVQESIDQAIAAAAK